MNTAPFTFVQQLEAMSNRLTDLYQEIDAQSSPVLFSAALKELGVASERLQLASNLIQQQHEQLLLANQATTAARHCYQELLEFIPDTCLFTDLSGKIQATNRAAASLLKLSPTLLKNRSLGSFVISDMRASFEADLQHLQQQTWRKEWQLCLQPHQSKPVWVNAVVEVSRTQEPMLRWFLRFSSLNQSACSIPSSEAELDCSLELYHKGEMIPFEPEIIWQVRSGMVKLTTFLSNGQEAVMGLAGASAPFGASLTALALYEATALVNTQLWRIPVAELSTSAQLQQYLLPHIKQRLQQAELLLAIHGQPRVADRFYGLLQLLKQEVGQPTTEGIRLSVRLTHEDLAATCCTTRVTITRLISELQQQNKLTVDAERHLILKE